jgi:hypothetical protein
MKIFLPQDIQKLKQMKNSIQIRLDFSNESLHIHKINGV